jgi:hypothetical protein
VDGDEGQRYVRDLSAGSPPRPLVSKPGVQHPVDSLSDGRVIVFDTTEPNLSLARAGGTREMRPPPIRPTVT